QPGHGSEESRSLDGAVADLVPGLEQLVRLPEQLPPDLRTIAVWVDHRQEVATKMSPANLSRPELDPLVPGEAVADDDQLGPLTEQLRGDRTGSGSDDSEDDPPPGEGTAYGEAVVALVRHTRPGDVRPRRSPLLPDGHGDDGREGKVPH